MKLSASCGWMLLCGWPPPASEMMPEAMGTRSTGSSYIVVPSAKYLPAGSIDSTVASTPNMLWPWLGMFSGSPNSDVARSVPWSRLKPRANCWLLLPGPLCCVITTPGTVSSTSPARISGRRRSSSAPTTPSLALPATPTRVA